MRHDPLFLLWAIHCPSEEACRHLQEWLPAEITPDAVFVNEVRTFPEGSEPRRESHRLGDYFASIQVIPSADSPTVLRLLFRRLPTAPRFWKDLMARLLHLVRTEVAQTTTTLEYQADEEPVAVLAKE